MKYCKNCGEKLEDNVKKCPKCGNPVVDKEEDVVNSFVSNSQNIEKDYQNNTIKKI